ncbi:MAG: hypothetical protein ABEJ72_03800 [Candidatus Aenigmatarchaeota archaeon]
MESMSLVGIILVLLGVTFLVIPAVGKYISLEDIPSWIIYVYENGNFYFVTSPLLIVLSLVVLVLHILKFI